jgi:creatinine amidohydrolase
MRFFLCAFMLLLLSFPRFLGGQYQSTERQWEKIYGNRLFELIEERPLAWLPVGVLERHGQHLPWGLDGDKAHLVCLRLAGKLGGVVLPTSHLAGIHGDRAPQQNPQEFRDSHRRVGDFIFTEDYLRTFLYQSFDGLANLGFRVIVAYTGHYPTIQTRVLQETAEAYTAASGGSTVVIPFWESLACGEGDHGARWESSIWAALVPGGVRMDSIVDYGTGRTGWYRGSEIKSEISAEFGEKALEMIEEYFADKIDGAFEILKEEDEE